MAQAWENLWKNMENTQSMTNFYWWDILQLSFPLDFLFVLVIFSSRYNSLLKYLHLLLHLFFSLISYLVLQILSAMTYSALNQENVDNAIKLRDGYIAKLQFPLEIHIWYKIDYRIPSQAKLSLLWENCSYNHMWRSECGHKTHSPWILVWIHTH